MRVTDDRHRQVIPAMVVEALMERQQGGPAVADLAGDAIRSATVRAVAAVAEFGEQGDALRVRLSGRSGYVVAQAGLVAAGRRVRVQVAAASYPEAVDAMVARLRRRVAEVRRPWSPRSWPDSGDGAVALYGSGLMPGSVVKVKRRDLVRCDVVTAAVTMDALDFHAYLFTDAETDTDAVVYRAGPVGYRLARLHPAPPPQRTVVPLVVDARPVPMLTRERAARRLDESGLPHLFYADPGANRGALLYRRFDGHYALIEAAR